MTDETRTPLPELQPTAAPDMRVPGWELVEPARINAEYWQNASRATDDGAEAVLAMEQAHNAYKNCAYALAEKLSRVPSATPFISEGDLRTARYWADCPTHGAAPAAAKHLGALVLRLAAAPVSTSGEREPYIDFISQRMEEDTRGMESVLSPSIFKPQDMNNPRVTGAAGFPDSIEGRAEMAIAAWRSQCEQMKAASDRYMWLRRTTARDGDGFIVPTDTRTGRIVVGEELDAYIDSALSASRTINQEKK